MENLVFTQLSIPEVRQLFRQELQTFFESKPSAVSPSEADELLTIQQAAELRKLSVPTRYGSVSRSNLPVSKGSTQTCKAILRHKSQSKGSRCNTQLQIVFVYLQQHIATASMVTAATGIPQKNICRYKRALEKAGWLVAFKKEPCKITGRPAWYLTTNKKEVTSSWQLKLFPNP